MRAIVCHELTGPASLRLEELAEPRPGPGQVRIGVRACGVNFADSLITRGQYQKQPQLPFSPGFEVSGEVLELAAGVEGVARGDRVLAMTPCGGYAEQVVADANRCLQIPAEMSWEHAAAFPVVFGTSHIALWRRARLQSGETLVVHGASGGVGLTAVAIGKQLGATVIATASSPEKLALAAAHGADHLLDSSCEDVRERIRELTAGRGADVVYDPVGGELFTASLRSMALEGRILVIGFAGGGVPQIPANHLLVKNVDVIGVNWPAYAELNPRVMTESLQTLVRWYVEGAIKPHVSASYPLEEALAALDQVVTRKSTGKVVITTA
ncbi:MAG: Quinone oxidoreductase 1 [Candidatus Accumulibacter regalis]|uniref:Quinone oxidoreductase 1 n=1 Tax=Accumulibacter regalis TaxID=522306 RepID=A0A011QJ10_ACCRE|nr:NADPH:quinone oxidoreductase family protein [Accumulibacter sp.]EXI89347.1 MAG: Quinone oxidoreductase 1 [Candidatus Accumulibacter regalis]MQM33124.1 zinc-binding dehydrogenase [Candidatus Accumulibacter phosphatis]MBL8367656.1 NADPH:quinone oxidoreductase family protein [Accumulibacter sp.]MBN8513778.1 NADPH:quinone oxidoreductase family protein [Accumulibacter sp.]MBO3704423.1 NADPH:quinone oxidoreductase family protein [Accumulibacter sp.]